MVKKFKKLTLPKKLALRTKLFLIFLELLSIQLMEIYTKQFMKSFIMMLRSKFQIRKEK